MMGSDSPHPPLALIANDQEWSARSLESILSPNGYAVLRAQTGRQAFEQARSARPDVLLLDAGLPDLSGIEVCRALRAERTIGSTTPILITTAGPTPRRQRLDAFKAGAWDTLGLPLDAEELLLKLATYVTAKFEADHVRDGGLLDEHTGLYNLRGLLQRARELGADASRYGRPLACVVFTGVMNPIAEVDEPEEESLHAAIAHLARTLRAEARGSDAIGRLGQAEFVVLAPGTDEGGALQLARRFAAAIQRAGISDSAAPGTQFRLRAGYCGVPDFHAAAIDPLDLVVRATMALRRQEPAEPGDGIHIFSFDLQPVPGAPQT